METVHIAAICAGAVVLITMFWIFRERLTDFLVRFPGFSVRIKAAKHRPDSRPSPQQGVILDRSKLRGVKVKVYNSLFHSNRTNVSGGEWDVSGPGSPEGSSDG